MIATQRARRWWPWSIRRWQTRSGPARNAIGRNLRPSTPDVNSPWWTVVGVVDDVKNAGLDRPAGTELYLSYRQVEEQGVTDMYVVARTSGGNSRWLASVVREQLNELDPSLALADVRMMDDVLQRAQARPR